MEILLAEHLFKYFPLKAEGLFQKSPGNVHAVDDVSLSIREGETFGLVGESGCGKTTVGRLVLRLLEPTGGRVLFQGEDIYQRGPQGMRALRRQMQIIFQDAYSSFDVRKTVGDIVGEPLRVHGLARGRELRKRVAELLRTVGLKRELADHYPHELSSGQKQCAGIARALALEPKFLVADEPVSNLDVSVRAQVLNLLRRLQQEFGLTYLFIAHDMSVIRYISERVGVMYLGKLVETAPREVLFDQPDHPYTKALLAAVPINDPAERRARQLLEGDVPTPVNPPPGCRFAQRCVQAFEPCTELTPELVEIGPDHHVACHLFGWQRSTATGN